MTIRLDQPRWEITDDVQWTKDWVGLSHGDIYRDDQPFGHYVAAWYPNTDRPLAMIVTVIDVALGPVLSIGVHCLRGDLNSLAAVSPEQIPWESDGVMFGPITRLEEFSVYSKAQEALKIAKEVVLQDRSIRKYICAPEMPIQAPREDEYDDPECDGAA
jgi:hypothetical protein